VCSGEVIVGQMFLVFGAAVRSDYVLSRRVEDSAGFQAHCGWGVSVFWLGSRLWAAQLKTKIRSTLASPSKLHLADWTGSFSQPWVFSIS